MFDFTALVGVLCLAVALLGAVTLVTAWNARRKVLCPDGGKLAEIECDAAQALRHTFRNEPEQVIDCSRWPAKAGCDQGCVRRQGRDA